MKKLALILLYAAAQLQAAIQDGKFVADCVEVTNSSFLPVTVGKNTEIATGPKIGSQQLQFGTDLHWFYPSSKEITKTLEGSTIKITLNNGTERIINVPLVDSSRPYTKFGPESTLQGYTPVIKPNTTATYDINISRHWIFGQKITVGTDFEKWRKSQFVLNALAQELQP